MVMELGSTRWTANSPRTFARAPGAGLGYHSGFAATPADATGQDILVIGKGPFTVVREPVPAGTVPGMVATFRYTDRGTLTKDLLDKQLSNLLGKTFKMSQTLFKSEPVTWRWQKDDAGATFYYPVIATPANMAGIRYSGNHVQLPVYEPNDSLLINLPREIWVYSIGITSKQNTMSDAEAAQALTAIKQAMTNLANNEGYANVLLTLKGLPPGLFNGKLPAPTPTPTPKPVVAGFSALILLAAYNMIAPHIGSERL